MMGDELHRTHVPLPHGIWRGDAMTKTTGREVSKLISLRQRQLKKERAQPRHAAAQHTPRECNLSLNTLEETGDWNSIIPTER